MLTDRQVRSLKPKTRDYAVVDATGTRGQGRLQIRVRTSGSRLWFFVYWMLNPETGKSARKMVQLGTFPLMSLAEAREAAGKLSALYQQGVDVREHLRLEKRREAERQAAARRLGTFGDLLEAYLSWMEKMGRRSVAQVRASLDIYVVKPFPTLLQRRASEITPSDIRDVIARMLDRGVTTHANRVRSYLHTAFAFGLKAEHDPREYLGRSVSFGLQLNPVSAIPRQSDFERVGERLLTVDEVRVLWARAAPVLGVCAGTLPLLCLASGGQRAGELSRLSWTHVDIEKELLTIPSTISKNKLDHLVPIGSLAAELLDGLRPVTGSSGLLFPGRKVNLPMHAASIASACKRFCVRSGVKRFTLRDLRRTSKTHMGEAGLSKEIRDYLQNHAMRADVSAKHYDRWGNLPEKRAAIARWDQWLRRMLNPGDEGSNVVTLSR